MRRLLLSTLVLLLLAKTVMADQLSDEAKRDIEAAKSNALTDSGAWQAYWQSAPHHQY